MATKVDGTAGITFPDGVNFNVDKSLAAKGYQEFPGGLIIQWGVTTASDTSVVFYQAFPHACSNVQVSWFGNPGNAFSYWLNATNVTNYGFNLIGASANRFLWMAIGY